MKSRARQLKLNDIRVNMSGCLERCELGPAMVIYPEGVWYRCETTEDIDEILQTHVIEDRRVERLMLEDGLEILPFDGAERMELTVGECVDLAPEVISLKLYGEQGSILPAFQSGSHIDLLIADDGRKISCWMTGDRTDDRAYAVSVWLDSYDSEQAGRIRNRLTAGATVQSTRPKCQMELDDAASAHLIFACGFGMASALSLCRHFKSVGARFEVHCFFDSQQGETGVELPHVQELAGICSDEPLNVPMRQSPAGFDRHGGAFHLQDLACLDAAWSEATADRGSDVQVHVCGPRRFVDFCSEFSKVHAPMRQASIVTDAVRGPSGSEFDVVLSRRRKRISVGANQTIIDALNANGYPADYECADGSCGRCRVRFFHGDTAHPDAGAMDWIDCGHLALCASRAAAHERCLVLDL